METDYESKLLNKIRKLKVPTERFEERLLVMDMTAEQFVDSIGYDHETFLGNVANVRKDLIHNHKMKTDLLYRVDLRIKELKTIIDREPESLEHRIETVELESYKNQLRLIKMKYNFYLRFLKYYKDKDNKELYDKCIEMYDRILKTVLEIEPVTEKGNSNWIRDELAEISIFIPVHRVDLLI